MQSPYHWQEPRRVRAPRATRRLRFQKPSMFAVLAFLTLPTLGWFLARVVMHLRDAS